MKLDKTFPCRPAQKGTFDTTTEKSIMRRSIIAIGLAAAVLVTAACSTGGEAQPGTSDVSASPITIGQVAIPTSFSVDGYTAGSTIQYYSAVFDTLIRQNAEGEAAPGLATEWTWDDTRTHLTLTLQDGVTFTDGVAFDADVAVANLNHFRESTAADINLTAGITAVEATAPSTVVITLAAPDPAFVTNLAYAPGYVSSPDSWDNPDVDTNPVGSGPYVLNSDSTVIGSSYVFDKNEDYWDDSVTQFPTVTMNLYSSPIAIVNALQAGEADAAFVLDVSSLDQIESAGFTLNMNRVAWQGLVLMDRDGAFSPELADVRVRQALNYAIDHDGLLQAVQGGHGSPTSQTFPEVTSAYDPALDDYYAFDPDKARELLEQAGYGEGFTLTIPTATGLNATMFTLVQQMLADVGVTLELEDVGTSYVSEIVAGKYSAAWMLLGGASTWYDASLWVTPTAPFNPFKSEEPELNEMLTAIQTGDEATADAAAQQMSTYLVKNAWFAPFFFSDNFFATAPELSVFMPTEMPAPFMYGMTTATS